MKDQRKLCIISNKNIRNAQGAVEWIEYRSDIEEIAKVEQVKPSRYERERRDGSKQNKKLN